jgi:hypothetical protein
MALSGFSAHDVDVQYDVVLCGFSWIVNVYLTTLAVSVLYSVGR